MTNKKPKNQKNILYIRWDDKEEPIKAPNKDTYQTIQDIKDKIKEIKVNFKEMDVILKKDGLLDNKKKDTKL